MRELVDTPTIDAVKEKQGAIKALTATLDLDLLEEEAVDAD